MTNGTESTGTPTPAAADGGNPTGTPAPVAEGGGAEGSVDWKARAEEAERKFQQSLLEKQNLEDERRRRQELETENERLRAGGYAPAPATGGNLYAEAAAQMQRNYIALKNSDDPRDQMLAANIDYTRQLEAQQRFNTEMATIPPAEQKAVAERAQREGLSPSLALDRIEAERFRTQRGELDARRKKLDEEEAARSRGRVDTTVTPVAARDLQNGDFATPTDYTKTCKDAERERERGEFGPARQRLRDFDEERIHIRGA